ncbi:hypothetical protein Agub_g2652, partial [Astrephomene gubernaculifera]
LLLAVSAGMAVWGMLALDEQLVAAGWGALGQLRAHGQAVVDGLEDIRGNLSRALPQQLNTSLTSLAGLLAPGELAGSAEAVANYTSSSQPAVASLLSTATALQSALASQLLPGLANLSAQLTTTTTTTTTNSSSSTAPPASSSSSYGT